MEADTERYSLASIRRQLADGTKLPSPSEVAWLLEEAERLTRLYRAMDRELSRMEAEMRVKDSEFTAAESELLDVSDELSKCRQELAAVRGEVPCQAAAPQISEHESCATAEGHC